LGPLRMAPFLPALSMVKLVCPFSILDSPPGLGVPGVPLVFRPPTCPKFLFTDGVLFVLTCPIFLPVPPPAHPLECPLLQVIRKVFFCLTPVGLTPFPICDETPLPPLCFCSPWPLDSRPPFASIVKVPHYLFSLPQLAIRFRVPFFSFGCFLVHSFCSFLVRCTFVRSVTLLISPFRPSVSKLLAFLSRFIDWFGFLVDFSRDIDIPLLVYIPYGWVQC